MLSNYIIVVPSVVLCALLSAAVWHDVRTRRIPNKLVLIGLLVGLSLNTLLPVGAGFFNPVAGAVGFLPALGGAALGLGTLIPLYAVGAMGAGDVKLMAMVGAFLGPEAIIGAALLSLLAGGVLALVVALWTGTLVRVIQNTYYLLLHAIVRAVAGTGVRIDKPVTPTSKLAYAIAIASGTVLDIFLTRTHAWSILP